MEPAKVNSASTPNYLFLMNVSSANAEDNSTLENNRYEIGIPLKVEVELSTFGVSEPDVISYNYSALDTAPFPAPQTLEEIGKEISHSYTVQNKGPTTISKAEVTILWPTRDKDRNFLLYLVDQVQVKGKPNKGFCRTITRDDLNPLGLKVTSPHGSTIDSLTLFLPLVPQVFQVPIKSIRTSRSRTSSFCSTVRF